MSEVVSVAEPKFIQIRKIRGYGESANQIPFEPDLVFKNTREVLKDYKKIVDKIPEHERYNIFFTLGYTVGENPKDRIEAKWMGQDVLFFDIDKIDLTRKLEYVQIFEEVLKVPRTKFFSQVSGHGLHFYITLKNPIESLAYFTKNRLHFQIICGHLNDRLKAAGLEGEADLDVFSPKRLGRLPLTLNRKPNRPENMVETITENFEEVDVDLAKISGLPEVDSKEQISKKELTYFRIDQETVLQGCSFLKFAKENASSLSEPEWYAALSIVGRLPEGTRLAHEISQEHPSYTHGGTERKLSQALKSSGPRTCDNIESMYPGCQTCPNYKKVKSPIQLKGPKFISTKDTGFHILQKNQLIPQYRDLMLFYEDDAPFITDRDSGTHYKWNQKFWEDRVDRELESWAQDQFKPFVKSHVVKEFVSTLDHNNVKPHKVFYESTSGRINLQNGILDLSSQELIPHTPDLYFRECLPFEFQKDATAPLFQKMLDGVTMGDEDLKKILQEYFGYVISGVPCHSDKMLVLPGEGQNGKSRFIQILSALVGKQKTKLTFSQIKSDFARMNLDGALFCLFEEVPKASDKEQWELLKDWSAGGEVSACRKFENFVHFENKAKIILTCNVLPQGTDPSHGYFRRLLIVPFKATFSDELGNLDRTIADRIIASELPGVLNWALEGYQRLKRQEFRFTHSEAVDEAVNAYKLHVDSTARFFDDYSLELGEPGELSISYSKADSGRHGLNIQSFYKVYATSCQDQGDFPLSQKVFTERLKTHLQKKFGGLWTKIGERAFELRGSVPNVSMVRCKVNKTPQIMLHGVRVSSESGVPEL